MQRKIARTVMDNALGIAGLAAKLDDLSFG
jgi:hypothetical protein